VTVAVLRIRTPGRPPWEVPLDADEITIGRGDDAGVVIDEDEVSRRHAVLRYGPAGWSIEDLGSRNGVFVNDAQVARHTVEGGESIRLGRTVHLELLDDHEAGAAAAPSRRGAGRDVSRAAPRTRGGGPLGFLRVTEWALRSSDPRARGRPVRLAAARTTVGRDASAGIPVDDDSLSRIHARIDRDAEGLVVTDLKSRNGTLVNGEPVLQSPLEPGDVVQFGNIPFEVVRSERFATARLLAGAGVLAALVAVGFGVRAVSESLAERNRVERVHAAARRQIAESVREGIDAWRAGDADFARGYLGYAADVLMLADLAPEGASLERPAALFGNVLRELPESYRTVDFGALFDTSSVALQRAAIEALPDREFVAHETRRFAIELGQAPAVPDGFVEEVWTWVDAFIQRDRGTIQTWMGRSVSLQPVLRQELRRAHLPEIFAYVAWVESGLNPRARSPVGAVGLWQLMPPTARQYGLRVTEGGFDERTDPHRATGAAATYVANLLRKFGPEQFMCALASYNRGEGGVWRAMEKIPDPLMPSSRKYWYLVENRLLPEETSKYVPKIFAVAIIAENPERFGFRRTGS
jgi:pSer/pThr/pTyr-binding forkhead associated (FHA) protein